VQRSGYPSRDVKEHMRDLRSLGLTVLLTEYLAEDVLEIALSRKITAYDACYIAVAAKLGLPLITADKSWSSKSKRANTMCSGWAISHGREGEAAT
jgi:predicted nucleic acid-binding protein